MHTTLNAIRQCRPCADGWAKLLSHLNKTAPDDEPLALTTILDANGLDDAIWALYSLEDHERERELRLFAVACARQVQHLMTDSRSIAALDVAERYANGQCTEEELSIARQMALYVYGDAGQSAVYASLYAGAQAAYHAARAANKLGGAKEIQAKQTALFREFFAS